MDELTAKYRATFSGIGQDVLRDILEMCHFWEILMPTSVVEIAEFNVGRMILKKMGAFSLGCEDDLVRALSAIVPVNKNNETSDDVLRGGL